MDISAGQLDGSHPHVPEEALQASTWINGQDLVSKIGDASRDAYVEWLSEMANQPILHGASIREWFTYRGEISMWWFTKMSEKHPVHHPYKRLFYQIHVLEYLTGQSVPASDVEWYLWVDSQYVGRALAEACSADASVTVSVIDHQSSPRLAQTAKEWLKSFTVIEAAHALKRGSAKIVQEGKHLYREVRSSRSGQNSSENSVSARVPDSESPFVLFHTRFPKSWMKVGPEERGRALPEKLDRYFGDAPFRLRENGFEVGWLPDVRATDVEKWEEVAQGQPMLDASPWMRLSVRDAITILLYRFKWLFFYIWVFVINRAQDEWKYKDIPLGYWLKRTYEKEILGGGDTWTRALINLHRYRSVYAALDPDCVLYRDEFYPRSGRQVSAALKGRVRLLGVQHGMISRDHTVYQWQKRDLPVPVDTRNPDHVQDAPVPDRFLAFGEYYVEQFEEWDGYPADCVIPVGGLRHDGLVERFGGIEAAQTSQINQEYHLPTDVPVLLLCTGLAEQAGQWFRMVTEAVQSFDEEVFVAVKLHPYHGGEDRIHDAAKDLGFTSYSVYREGIYPLMAASDVLVTGTSTTLLEGNLLGLSAISIVANSEYEPYPYTREELARVVSSEPEMSVALRAVIVEGKFKDGPSPTLPRHLRNHDGRACERAASYIRSQVRAE